MGIEKAKRVASDRQTSVLRENLSMHDSPSAIVGSEAVARVRRHFDSNTNLYVDLYAAQYRAICQERIEPLREYLDSGKSSLALDVGCGGGVFIDMLLDRYPNARAFGLDFSVGMLARNMSHPRKNLILGNAKKLPFGPGTFDLINVDTVMHHLIDSAGYNNTLEGIKQFLLNVRDVLKPGGLLIVHEIYHEFVLRDHLGSRVVFELSTLKLPVLAANLLKRIGMNTANAGVCFLTRRQWNEMFEGTHYEVLDAVEKPWVDHAFERLGFNRNGDLYFTLRSMPNGSIRG